MKDVAGLDLEPAYVGVPAAAGHNAEPCAVVVAPYIGHSLFDALEVEDEHHRHREEGKERHLVDGTAHVDQRLEVGDRNPRDLGVDGHTELVPSV